MITDYPHPPKSMKHCFIIKSLFCDITDVTTLILWHHKIAMILRCEKKITKYHGTCIPRFFGWAPRFIPRCIGILLSLKNILNFGYLHVDYLSSELNKTERLWTAEHRFNFYQVYRKFPKYSDTQKICSNHSKIWTMWLYHREICPNDADGMANSVDPDQTAPLGAVWSGSALFAQACLSENLGSLQYSVFCI